MKIIIPEALAREIAANPERFRPAFDLDPEILVLHRPSEGAEVGLLGRALGYCPPEPGITFAREEYSLSGVCDAWALVGSVEEPVGGPRPVEGDRVLVIKTDVGARYIDGHVGIVSNVPRPSSCGHFHQPDDWSGTPGAILVDFDPGVPFSSSGATMSCRVTRWAILPPAVQPDPMAAEAFHSAGETTHVEQCWRNSGRFLYVDRLQAGMVDTAELAAAVVEAMNGPGAEIARLNALLADRPANLLQQRNDAIDESARLHDFQNSIANRIPEEYEASEGNQESCINKWLDDVTAGRWVLTPEDLDAMVGRMFRHMGYTDEEINAAGSAPAHTPECYFESNSYRWECTTEDGKSRHPLRDEIEMQAALLMVALGYDGEAPTDIDPLGKLKAHKAQVLQSFYEDLVQAGFDDEAVLGILERRIARAEGRDPEAGGQDG